MSTAAPTQKVLDTLASARLVVTHAERLGIDRGPSTLRDPVYHLGAILAERVLGLYR